MKILHVIPSVSLTQGGPSFALPRIVRSLQQNGIEVDVATTNDDGPGKRLILPVGSTDGGPVCNTYYFSKQSEFYKLSLPFWTWIRQHVTNYNLVHIHALFSFTSTVAAIAARRARVPYVVRPLGVLNQWGMTYRRPLLKSLSFRFIENPILQHAAVVHYTAKSEQREAELAGCRAPAVVIPLGLDLTDFAAPAPEGTFYEVCPQAKNREVVLFLSRLDPKKAPDVLLQAFRIVLQGHRRAILVMAGEGDPAYVASLKAQATALGLGEHVAWPGFLGGQFKLSALGAATVYVLPSYSENFGIALVEALAAGLPCVSTPGVAVSEEIQEHNAGVIVPAEQQALAGAISRLLSDARMREQLSANARHLAAERFSLSAMGASLRALYESILRPAPKVDENKRHHSPAVDAQ